LNSNIVIFNNYNNYIIKSKKYIYNINNISIIKNYINDKFFEFINNYIKDINNINKFIELDNINNIDIKNNDFNIDLINFNINNIYKSYM